MVEITVDMVWITVEPMAEIGNDTEQLLSG